MPRIAAPKNKPAPSRAKQSSPSPRPKPAATKSKPSKADGAEPHDVAKAKPRAATAAKPRVASKSKSRDMDKVFDVSSVRKTPLPKSKLTAPKGKTGVATKDMPALPKAKPAVTAADKKLQFVKGQPIVSAKPQKTGASMAAKLEASRALRTLIEKSLDDDKAENVVSYDLTGRSSLTDCMIIATGNSSRQVSAMAEHLREKLEEQGKTISIEGANQGDWVLIDAGDVVVHLFRPEVRAFYHLEQLWAPEAVGVQS